MCCWPHLHTWILYGPNSTEKNLSNQDCISVVPVTIIISGIFILLSRVDVVFLSWSLFPVFPRIQTVACVFYFQSNFIGSYFLYSPRRPNSLIDFICVLFIGCPWVAVSGIPPFSNLFLLILVSRFFFDWLKYLETMFRLRSKGKYICGGSF